MPGSDSKKSGISELLSDLHITRAKIKPLVEERINGFKSNKNWFSELCFCIMTANYTASGGIKIQNSIPDFSSLSLEELKFKLKELGHRFPNTRAEYIFCAIPRKQELELLKNMDNSAKRREWLVENIKGLGYKEASHFLRNIGYLDVAIIDKHILNLLSDYKIIEKPKTITKKTYLEIENKLKEISSKAQIPLGELDLYLWYMKTGKVLK